MSIRPDFTFGRFIPTPGTSEAFALAAAVASGHARAPSLLLVSGPPGVGKTHLLHAIQQLVSTRRPSATLIQTNGLELVQDLVAAFRGESENDPRSSFSRAELVVIDDLQVLAGKPVTQRQIAALLKSALEAGTRIACAASCELMAIPEFVDAIRHLPAARVVKVRPPYRHEIPPLVAAMAKAQRIHLGHRTLAAISTQCRGDVRCAAGALVRHRFQQL